MFKNEVALAQKDFNEMAVAMADLERVFRRSLLAFEEVLKKQIQEALDTIDVGEFVVRLKHNNPRPDNLSYQENAVYLCVDRLYTRYDFGESTSEDGLRQKGMNPDTTSNMWPVKLSIIENQAISELIEFMQRFGYIYENEFYSNYNFNVYKFIV